MAQNKTETRKISVLPVPTLGSSPETSWYFGAVSLFTLNLFDDTVTRVSTINFELSYTLNKQFIAEAEFFINSRNNKYIFFGENTFLKFPELYWGIGNAQSENDVESYSANRLEIYNGVLKRIKPNLYAGFVYRFHQTFDIELESGSAIDPFPYLASGLGWSLLLDKRDNILNPSANSRYFKLEQLIFQPAFGSQIQFSSLLLDAREYMPLFRKHVIAFQLFGQSNFGKPSFRMLSLLGSDSHMRGYYEGRYRDKHYFCFQTEARIQVYKRFGAAFFAGFGDVFGSHSTNQIKDLKPSLGGGLRIMMDKSQRTNLRIDYALGQNTSGFYFSFGEAF